MIIMLPIFVNSAVLSGWHWACRRPRAGKTTELTVAYNVSSEAESPKDIKALLEAARRSNGLDDLEKFLAIPADAITVIHEGVHSFEKVPDAVLPPSIQKPYYINVGNAYPHKNIPFLLNVFEELKRRSASCMLVLVGQQDYFRERIIERIRAKNLSDTVIHLGFVSDAQLWALYRHARAALFPSFHEGFGFGPLEAASAGTPLIVSNIPCFHETLGDAALYIDPRDIHAMIASITVLESDSVQRASLIQRGKERASLFSWDRAAKKTHTLYHSFARNAST